MNLIKIGSMEFVQMFIIFLISYIPLLTPYLLIISLLLLNIGLEVNMRQPTIREVYRYGAMLLWIYLIGNEAVMVKFLIFLQIKHLIEKNYIIFYITIKMAMRNKKNNDKQLDTMEIINELDNSYGYNDDDDYYYNNGGGDIYKLLDETYM